MRVAVTGGTGFIGSALVKGLLGRGDEVWIVTRSAESVKQRHARLQVITWKQLEESPDRLEGTEAIVNLAGESIDQRWTDAAKERVLQSRLTAASRIATLVSALKSKPRIVVNASGVSYYGTSLTETFDERSPQRVVDFLSSVVAKWEEAADRIPVERMVKLRAGLLIDNGGGAFPKMVLPYRLFSGGRIGSGKQWIPWIHLEDMIRLILFSLDNERISGPVNAVSPEPVTSDEFGRAIGRAMKRPHWFPVPAFLMKALFGEMAVLLLEGQKALPTTALDAGFQFRFPDVDSAMRDLVGN